MLNSHCLNSSFHTDPSHWGGRCKTGKTQSPIDINSKNTIVAKYARRLRFNMNYFDSHDEFYIKNNGHTGNGTIPG